MSSELKELFQHITRYTPQTVELDTKLKPFIPEFIPAIGDIDAFLKVHVILHSSLFTWCMYTQQFLYQNVVVTSVHALSACLQKQLHLQCTNTNVVPSHANTK